MESFLASLNKEKREWRPLAVQHGHYDPLMVGSIDGTDDRPHDRAILRAVDSKYTHNKQVKGDPKSTLFVARLNPSTTEDTLKDHFGKYGKIQNCRLVRDLVTGRSKCYGFVEYRSERDAQRGYERGHHCVIDEAQVIVEMELERVLPGWKPRRFGGGFGGKKESGQLRFGGRDRTFRKPIVLGSRRFDSSGGGSHFEEKRSRENWRDRRRSRSPHKKY